MELHCADLLGWGSPGSLGGLFRQKKLVIFLWVFVSAVVGAVVDLERLGGVAKDRNLLRAQKKDFKWVWDVDMDWGRYWSLGMVGAGPVWVVWR